jgi:hypothetical protein
MMVCLQHMMLGSKSGTFRLSENERETERLIFLNLSGRQQRGKTILLGENGLAGVDLAFF